MRQPAVTLTIKNQHEISFRFRSVPRHKWHRYLAPFKNRFPYMHWDRCNREWILSMEELKSLYELCRLIFHPANIEIVAIQHTARARPIQPSLFDSMN